MMTSSFTVKEGSYAELEARNSITINGPLLAENGSEFEASVDDFLGVQARISALLRST